LIENRPPAPYKQGADHCGSELRNPVGEIAMIHATLLAREGRTDFFYFKAGVLASVRR
jgi:hypothetical protein